MMKYKGYLGTCTVDADAKVIRGQVVNTKDTITFQGKTVEDAIREFRKSVDDYLDFCASLGEPPEKPFSGKLLIRVNPSVHRDLAAVALAQGVSVNKWIVSVLAPAARAAAAPTEPTAARPPKPAPTRKARTAKKDKAPAH